MDMHLDRTFHWFELMRFIADDPVMKILQPRFTAGVVGVLTPLRQVNSKLEAARMLVIMLDEAGFTPESLDADRIFKLELQTIVRAAEKPYKAAAPVVGRERNLSSYRSHCQIEIQKPAPNRLSTIQQRRKEDPAAA